MADKNSPGLPLHPPEDEMVAVVEEARREARYLVTDYPVELLVQKFKEEPEQEGDIYIPEYQRKPCIRSASDTPGVTKE
jgi:hypothetical protein